MKKIGASLNDGKEIRGQTVPWQFEEDPCSPAGGAFAIVEDPESAGGGVLSKQVACEVGCALTGGDHGGTADIGVQGGGGVKMASDPSRIAIQPIRHPGRFPSHENAVRGCVQAGACGDLGEVAAVGGLRQGQRKDQLGSRLRPGGALSPNPKTSKGAYSMPMSSPPAGAGRSKVRVTSTWAGPMTAGADTATL